MKDHHRSYFSLIVLLATLWCLSNPLSSLAQGTTETFGQNKVQYKNFEWQYFESDNFVTYFYPGGQEIGKYTILYAESIYPELEKQLEFKVSKRIEILVYNDLSDLNQTNIGAGLQLNNTGGLTQIIQNKLFVYFNGDHKHLERQIREGMAKVFISHMIFGSNLQEVLQNAVLLNLPQWFTDGLASYIGNDWSSDMDDKLKAGILSGKYKKISNLEANEAQFVGHAIWHYVEEKYGSEAVPNLLYLTRINRSLESGFLYVLGGSVNTILENWYDTHLQRYQSEMEDRQVHAEESKVKKRPWKKRQHYQVKISPDGKYVAFATNILGQTRVHLLDREKNKFKRLLKLGHKTISLVTDNNYPLLAWSPDGVTLAGIYNKRDQVKMFLYNTEEKKKETVAITKFQHIHDFQFTNDPQFLVMSATSRGQTDIYTYYLPTTRLDQITNDYYDDLNPTSVEVNGRKGIIFSSNRPTTANRELLLDTTLINDNYDLFFFNSGTRSKELTRLTSTMLSNEMQPLQYDSSHFTYLTDDNGIHNRHLGYIKNIYSHTDTLVFFQDSLVTNPTWDLAALQNTPDNGIDSVVIERIFKDVGVTYPFTNFDRSILEHDIAPKSNEIVELVRGDKRFDIFVNDLPKALAASEVAKPKNTAYRDFVETVYARELKRVELRRKAREKALGNDFGDGADTASTETILFFQSDFNTAPQNSVDGLVGVDPNSANGSTEDGAAAKAVFQPTKVLPYRVKFSTDYVLTQIDNTLIMTRYDQFRPGSPVFNNPPLSGTINLGISDLFEDYRITGGFRFPFNFQGSEYWLAYNNLRRRLDKRIMYYRKVDKQSFGPDDVLPFVNVTAPASRPVNLPIDAKIRTNYAELRLTYAIDVTKSIRAFMAYRHEAYVYQANEEFTLGLETFKENWLFARVEFVQDQTIPTGLNLWNGFRFKVYAEIHKQFTIEKDTILNNLKVKLPNFDNRYFGVIGFDFRHYQKIHKELIWANRLAGASSFGTRRLIYYLGGVDNWIGARFNNDTPIGEENDYAFQTVATNMRGFDQNIRNGNNFLVLNSEIRWPIFTYMLNKSIRSEFVRNFQLVGFADVGTAWEGLNPYDEDNPLFTDQIGEGSVVVNVEFFRNPIVVGYGFGMRTTLFGYFMRFDIAWGKDSGETFGPKYYFSLSTDF